MRALGIDYGEQRIGLALSDPTGTLARPWRTIRRGDEAEDVVSSVVAVVEALAAEEDGLAAIVIGLPARLDGSPHTMTARVREFAERLRARVTPPVTLQDERLSSREAEARLAVREPDWRKRKAMLDAASAAVVLQDYLDSLASRDVAPHGEA